MKKIDMTKRERLYLASVLRELAKRVFDGWEPDSPGICVAVFAMGITPHPTHPLLLLILQEMKPHLGKMQYLCLPYRNWPQRAMMCLLMAEELEQR